jgi:patatin-like phospholipase/acyl hydrolase
MEKYKILSLDGGGSWALLQAMALKAIYKDTSTGTRCGDILKQFNLIVANSGGSLMLAAMIEFIDEDIDKVINIFLNSESRNKVFSPLKWHEKNGLEYLATLLKFGPRYKASRKYDGLKSILRETDSVPLCRLHEIRPGIPKNIVICGFDYDRNRAIFFRTNQDSKSQSSSSNKYEYSLTHAIHASSNAPVMFFDEPARFKIRGVAHQLWDGAVGGNNNPVLIGITEALAELKGAERSSESLSVLSIGTGNNMLPVKGFTAINKSQHPALMKEIEASNFKSAIKTMATSITSEPPDAANYMAHMFLGGKSAPGSEPAIIRLNPLLQPFIAQNGQEWVFPPKIDKNDHKDFVDLIALEMDATEQKEVLQIQKLGNWWIEDKVANQAIRLESSNLSCNIGHSDFSTAKAEWLKRSSKEEIFV